MAVLCPDSCHRIFLCKVRLVNLLFNQGINSMLAVCRELLKETCHYVSGILLGQCSYMWQNLWVTSPPSASTRELHDTELQFYPVLCSWLLAFPFFFFLIFGFERNNRKWIFILKMLLKWLLCTWGVCLHRCMGTICMSSAWRSEKVAADPLEPGS